MNNSKHQYFRPVWTSGRYDKKSHSAIIYNLASGKSYFFEDTAADVIDYVLIADRNEKIDVCLVQIGYLICCPKLVYSFLL